MPTNSLLSAVRLLVGTLDTLHRVPHPLKVKDRNTMADAQQLAPAEEPAALNQPAAEPAPAGQDSVTLTTEPPAVGQKRSLEQAEEGGQGEQAGGAGDEPAAAGGEPPATEAPEVKRQAVAADALPAATPAPASASEPQQVASQTAVPPGLDTPRETIFRLVLNVMDTALIIGKGGMTVRQIETETGELWTCHCRGCLPSTCPAANSCSAK